jgi:hypothetical protein
MEALITDKLRITMEVLESVHNKEREALTRVYEDLHVEQVPHPGLVEDQDALHDDHVRRV